MINRPPPVHTLPEDYEEVYCLSIIDTDKVLMLNVASIGLGALMLACMAVWSSLVEGLRGDYTVTESIPSLVLLLLVLTVLPLHEWIHGIAIRWAGHRPRYGMKGVNIGPITIPVVLFATADNAYFQRTPFIVIAMAPFVVITLTGMALMIFLPDYIGYYVGLALIINGAGAIGDIWMTVVVLRYPESKTLVRDEEDSIRVFVQRDMN